jgi:aryl-alcohol dehydrogenase-like predicted oxidoreductase
MISMRENVSIPGTDLALSPICLGTVNAGLTWDHEEAFTLMERYLELGGNVIDSARIYSDWVKSEIGRSERVIGDWIRERRHHEDFTLITKGGHPRMETIHTSRMRKSDMDCDIELSLRTLGVDCIDIYFYHRDDTTMGIPEILDTMEGYVREGKIRYYACSNWKTDRMREACQYAKGKGQRGFIANEALLNMGMKYMKPFPDDTMATMDPGMQDFHRGERSILAMPYFGVCSGFFHILDAKGEEAVKESPYYTPGNMKVKARIDRLREKYEASVTQVLLGFFFAQDYPIVPLCSADNISQLEDIMKAPEFVFEPADYRI